MEQLRIRDIKISVNPNTIQISDLNGGTTEFTPSEISTVRSLVHTVWRMSTLPAMPNEVNFDNTTFYAKVANGSAELRRRNDPAGNVGCTFKINEADFVIQALDLGLNKYRDMHALDPKPRATGQFVPSGLRDGDIIEGG